MSRSDTRTGRTIETEPNAPLIVHVPGVHGGEPVIRGTRVPVRSIVIAHERYGDVARVARSFSVEPDEVAAALAYYEAHSDEIDAVINQRERDAMA